MNNFRLSPSALSVFNDCPRCFWLEKIKGVRRPRGIFPSLPGGMDLIIKTYFDSYRIKGELPPELKGRVPGKLFSDTATLGRWRSWKLTDLIYEDKKTGVTLSGALDDCLIDGNFYIPLDYKTKGSAVKENPAKYYQTQLDSYCIMLEGRGYKTANVGYLLYFWPETVHNNGMIKFAVESYKITTSIESIQKILSNAAAVLNNPIPNASAQCEYCNFYESRKFQSDRSENSPQKTEPTPVQPASKNKELKEENGQYYFF